jgi:hypothetical protein
MSDDQQKRKGEFAEEEGQNPKASSAQSKKEIQIRGNRS